VELKLRLGIELRSWVEIELGRLEVKVELELKVEI
jgi:hypothetical protein